MTLLHGLVIIVAGIAAGTINTVVGSGTLITFPVLLALGYPPVTANVSNTIGLVPGSISGAFGYRAELADQRSRLLKFGSASLIGAIIGAFLLLRLPPDAFTVIVPVLIAIAVILVITQPWLKKRMAKREKNGSANGGPLLWLGILATGVYGGYFGASQGVVVMGITGVALNEDMQRLNAMKIVLTGLVNLVSGVIFVLVAHVAWEAAGLVAIGSVIGGILGARIGKRLSPTVLRAAIVVVGLAAITKLLLD